MHEDICHPVKKELSDAMPCGILTNAYGEIMIVHRDDIDYEPEWISYDPERRELSLVDDKGRYQLLGIEINRRMARHIMGCENVNMCQLAQKAMVKSQSVLLVIQDY